MERTTAGLVLLLITGVIHAQGISVYHEGTFGLTEPTITSGQDSSMFLSAVSDSGELVIWKTDYQGNVIWNRYLRIPVGDVSPPIRMLTLPDSSVVISSTVPASQGFVLMRMSSNGNLMGAMHYDSDSTLVATAITMSTPSSVTITGSYGQTPERGFAIRVALSGSVMNSVRFRDNVPAAKINLKDVRTGLNPAHVLFVGEIEDRPLLIATDTNLSSIIFSHRYSISNRIGTLHALAMDYFNGRYLMVGNIHIGGSTYGILYISDSLGNLRYTITYESIRDNEFRDIVEHPNGNYYVIAGMSKQNDPGGDISLLMVDDTGTIMDSFLLGQPGNPDYGIELSTAHDMRLWVVGQTTISSSLHKALISSFYTPGVARCTSPMNLVTGFPHPVDSAINIILSPLLVNSTSMTPTTNVHSIVGQSVCTAGAGERSEECGETPFRVINSAIRFESGTGWSLYDISGREIARGRGSIYRANTGTYILRVGGSSYKIVIR